MKIRPLVAAAAAAALLAVGGCSSEEPTPSTPGQDPASRTEAADPATPDEDPEPRSGEPDSPGGDEPVENPVPELDPAIAAVESKAGDVYETLASQQKLPATQSAVESLVASSLGTVVIKGYNVSEDGTNYYFCAEDSSTGAYAHMNSYEGGIVASGAKGGCGSNS